MNASVLQVPAAEPVISRLPIVISCGLVSLVLSIAGTLATTAYATGKAVQEVQQIKQVGSDSLRLEIERSAARYTELSVAIARLQEASARQEKHLERIEATLTKR